LTGEVRLKFALFVLAFWAVVSCGAATPGSELSARLSKIRWAAYAPTNYRPDLAPPVLPSDDSIRADLRVLRSAGFDGLITYGSQLTSIPKIAEEEGYAGILLGVWDPNDQNELRLASEGLMTHRYTAEALYKAMIDVRKNTGKPVSTTEVIEYFYTRRDLVDSSDFLTINAHPYFHGHRDAIRAVDWTVGAWRRIKRHLPDKPILFKEVGLPTAGAAENSEETQNDYYRRLLTTTDVVFAFFEAFDVRFKVGAVEQSWGLFHSDRSPKPAGSVLNNGAACSGPIKRPWCARDGDAQ
jgi:exo-beta-1,3-glucanase (GH17 family)